MSSFLIARSQGADMIALPVFPSRRLFQTELSYHVDSGITKPRRSRRQTSRRGGISANRGALDTRHFRTRLRRLAVQDSLVHGKKRGDEPRRRHRFQAAAGNIFQPHRPNKSLASTLSANELDVAHVASPWVLQANALDRSSRIAGKGDWSKIKPLFPDRMAEGSALSTSSTDFYRSTTPTSSAATFYRNIPGSPLNYTPALSRPKHYARRKTSGADSHGAFLRPGVSRDDPRNDRRRPVSLRYQSQSRHARHDHRFSHEQGLDTAPDESRRIIRRKHPRLCKPRKIVQPGGKS